MTVQDRPFTIGRSRGVPEPQGLPPDMEDWKAKAFQRLGWKSKTDKHLDTYDVLEDSSEIILQKGLRGQGPHGATAISGLLEGSGDTFRNYHELLMAFEGTDKRTPDMVSALKTAAKDYIDHFGEYGQSKKDDEKNIAKKTACEETLRELRKFDIAHESRRLGPPPWNSEQAMKAASLKAALDISTLPPGQQQVEHLDEGTASPTFWITRSDGDDEREKTFIFKPSCNDTIDPDFPPGGEPGREALAGRVADILNGVLGLKLPMPETQIVSLGRENLPEQALNQLKGRIGDKESYVGSVQQFEQADGNMHSLDGKGRDSISTRSTQELAIFDIITLNTDRHPGNFLVRSTDDDKKKELVPIDHGLTFPPPGVSRIAERLGSTGSNALLKLPGSHEPFDAELLQSIARLDPDAMAEALKRERATMETVHEDTKDTLSDGAIEQSRRSAMFLKLAAPRLTPASIQIALSQSHQELLDINLDPDAFSALAKRIIAGLEDHQEALKEYCLMPQEMQFKMARDLKSSGWSSDFNFKDSLIRNPGVGLKIWKMGLDGNAPPKHDTGQRPMELNEKTDKELEAIRQAFPETKIPNDGSERALIENWREWNDLGGTQAELDTAMRLGGSDTLRKNKIKGDLAEALTCLKRGRTLEEALENDKTDTMLFDMAQAIKYMEELLPAMRADDRRSAQQLIDTIKPRLEGKAPLEDHVKSQLHHLLKKRGDRFIDNARARLLDKYKILIDNEPDDKVRKIIKKERDDVESYNIAGGYEKLHARAPELAEAE